MKMLSRVLSPRLLCYQLLRLLLAALLVSLATSQFYLCSCCVRRSLLSEKKTSRWFLLSAGLLLLIGGALNWWGLFPTFSWHGYEPDWPPICVGAFLVMMLLAIFGKVSRRRRRQR